MQQIFTRCFVSGFSDDEASQVCTPEEWYHFLSDDEHVCSFLACVKIIHGIDPVTREPTFGEPVLTVIHTPAVTLAGKSISGEEAWPDVPFPPWLAEACWPIISIHWFDCSIIS
jgi:hypothetical protein